MKKTIINRRVKQYYHTGRWEENKFAQANKDDPDDDEEDDAMAWSCCQDTTQEGGGCNSRLIDPDKMNIASF